MAKCVKCGKKGLFLKVNDDNICSECVHQAHLAEKDKYIQNLVKSVMPEQLNLIELNNQIGELNAEITVKKKELSTLKTQINITNENINKLKSETQTQICPEFEKNPNTNYSDSKSLYEQFKSEIKQNIFIKPIWLIYLIAAALIITCIAVFATPIAYNAEFIEEGSSNQYSTKYFFKRNNICQIENSYGTVSINLYYFEDDAIGVENVRAFKIINRTTIQSSNGHTYKADNSAEIFLIVLTVLWAIFSIAFAVYNHNKKMTKPDRLKQAN